MTIQLSLPRVAVHGETSRKAAQHLLEEQNKRDYPDETPPVQSAPCSVQAIFADDNGNRLELNITDWEQVATIQREQITIAVG